MERPGQVPPPPEALLRWVERFGTRGTSATEDASAGTGEGAPVASGIQALEAALRLPAGEREAAWALLAADHLLTLAVEEAALADDPAAALEAILGQVARVEPGLEAP
jgi:hypothetical protein